MPDLTLKRRLATGRGPNNIALNGVVYASDTTAVSAEVFYRFEDEPTAEPVLLGKVTLGHRLEVPIDLKGRPIRVFARSLTEKGEQSSQRIEEGTQALFSPSEAPTLASATFSTPDIDLVFASSGGIGTIRILRSIDGGAFGEIGTVAYSATTFSDTATVNGDFTYKLTQDGQDGESNSIEVAVTGIGGTAGTAPTLLDGTYDSMTETVTLEWTNNGGTGDIIVEERWGAYQYYTIATLANTAVDYDHVISPLPPYNRFYTYRVSNTSASGFSNEAEVYVLSS